MTPEERESIINEAVERTILMIPEVVGNLMMNHAAKIRANKKFYEKHPEFKEFKEVVASVIEQVEDSDLSKNFEDILTNAIPKIRKRIDQVKLLDTKKVEKPDLNFDNGVF
jgi:hypothetical protein